MRKLLFFLPVAFCFALLTSPALAAAPAGRIEVQFQYVGSGSVDPTYHTCICLEDSDGKMVRTLFVSNELSATVHKTGKACPDWVKQADWDKAPRSLVNAVAGPTPNVSSAMMPFDLGQLGIAPGTYRFRFEVNIDDQFNVLAQGDLVVGDFEAEVKIETQYLPSKPPIGTDVVKDVRVHYYPAKK